MHLFGTYCDRIGMSWDVLWILGRLVNLVNMNFERLYSESAHIIWCLNILFINYNLTIIELASYELNEQPSSKQTCWLYQATRKPSSMCHEQSIDDHYEGVPCLRTPFLWQRYLTRDLLEELGYNMQRPRSSRANWFLSKDPSTNAASAEQWLARKISKSIL